MKLARALLLVLLNGLDTAQAAGSVSTDGTLGPQQNLSGPEFAIPETLGRRAGSNLFHSFQRFSIDKGERATFTGSSSIRNVISRVTGGEVSTINGTLRSQVGKADVYFINPTGVVFGNGARLDVPAAFHAGTADQLKLRDGGSFNAVDPQASRLSEAPPAAFGFTTTSSANNGLLKVQGAQLEVKAGQQIDLVGRGIVVEDKAVIKASGGEARLVSAGSGAGVDVSLTPNKAGQLALPNIRPRADKAGAVQLDDSVVSTQGDGAGRIAVWGKRVTLSNRSKLDADNDGATNATAQRGVELRAGRLRLNERSTISADAEAGTGRAGNVRVTVDGAVELRNRGSISSSTYSRGNAGSVRLQAGELQVEGGPDGGLSDIGSRGQTRNSRGNGGTVDINVKGRVDIGVGGQISASGLGFGRAGTVKVTAGELRIKGNKDGTEEGILSRSSASAKKGGGKVTIEVAGSAVLLSGGKVSTDTSGAAAAGAIDFSAGALRLIGRGRDDRPSEISSRAVEESTGQAGQVTVKVRGTAEILDGARISTSTTNKGNAGAVQFAAGQLHINGGTQSRLSEISSRAEEGSTGAGGSLNVNVSGLADLRNSAQISTSTLGKGDGGTLNFHAGQLRIKGNTDSTKSGIFSQSTKEATGNAGSINVVIAGQADIFRGGKVSSNTEGPGQAGKVFFEARDLRIQGRVLTYPDKSPPRMEHAGIFSQQSTPGAKGSAGEVVVNVPGTVNILNGGLISSSTAGEGTAGQVTFRAGQLRLDGGRQDLRSEISSRSRPDSTGSAGQVSVTVAGLADLRRGGQINSSTQGKGNAGEVRVTAGSLHIDGNNFLANKAGVQSESLAQQAGAGGSIEVTASNDLEIRNGGTISSSTQSINPAGNVVVRGERVSVSHASIASAADRDSEATSGNVTVSSGSQILLTDSAEISARNAGAGRQDLQDRAGTIKLNAPRIDLQNSRITATSVGKNIAAGSIDLYFSKSLSLDPSFITTASLNGSGGDITLNGDSGYLVLKASKITTSVLGVRGGDGGNIAIRTKAMVLDQGQIHADTVGDNASGGRINLDSTQAIIARNNALRIGGETALNNGNVIQAASRNGIDGEIRANVPQLNLSGVIANLGAPVFDNAVLRQDLCSVKQASTLIRGGNGALPSKPWHLRRF